MPALLLSLWHQDWLTCKIHFSPKLESLNRKQTRSSFCFVFNHILLCAWGISEDLNHARKKSPLCGKQALGPVDFGVCHLCTPPLVENRVTHRTFPPLTGSLSAYSATPHLQKYVSMHILGFYTLHSASFCLLKYLLMKTASVWKILHNMGTCGFKAGLGTVSCVTSSRSTLCFCSS